MRGAIPAAGREVLIRAEHPDDIAAVHALNRSVFASQAEAELVDTLRADTRPLVALVAEDEDSIVGHILFTPVTVTACPGRPLMGLAPMAVTPARQRNGIGTRLVEAGLDRCRALGTVAVVVLGHPTYYPRFGFVPASRFGLRCEWNVPDEVFMALALRHHALDGCHGLVRYHAAFATV